jgi:AraC-like DNA-binding protein
MQIVINLHRNCLTDCTDSGATVKLLPRAIVVGARARFEVIDTLDMTELVGIAFRAGGFAKVFRERADLFFEQSIGLDEVWRSRVLLERLCDAVSPVEKLNTVDQLLSETVQPGSCRSELVNQTMFLLGSQRLSVAACARSAGISERRLSQVFREEVGLSPKTWSRIQRFQNAVRALHDGVDVPWAELALNCGYYDQSHFSNDFRAFSGIDPTTYSALRGRWQNHVPLP